MFNIRDAILRSKTDSSVVLVSLTTVREPGMVVEGDIVAGLEAAGSVMLTVNYMVTIHLGDWHQC
jgi:hypothetical protein